MNYFILKVISVNDTFIFQKLHLFFSDLDVLEFSLSKCSAVNTPLSKVKGKRHCHRMMVLIFSKRKKKNKEETWLSDLLKPAQQFRGNSKSLTQWTHDGCISQTHTQQGKRDEQLNTYQMVLHPGCYTYAIAFRMCRPYTIFSWLHPQKE